MTFDAGQKVVTMEADGPCAQNGVGGAVTPVSTRAVMRGRLELRAD